MPASRPASGGGRWVEVAPERLPGWLERFAERHDGIPSSPDVAVDADVVTVTASDGAVAECHVPFPPLAVDATKPYAGLVEHASAARAVAVLLVRRGGFAVGVFHGTQLVASKVGQRHVQGRTAAGGWSQQRFARRRAGQTKEATAAAADTTAMLLLPRLETLDALVTGGDRALVDDVLRDGRLAPLAQVVSDRRLDVPEPRLRVLESTPAQFRAVQIRVLDSSQSRADGA